MSAHLQINGKSLCKHCDFVFRSKIATAYKEAFVICQYDTEQDARHGAEILAKHGIQADVMAGPCLEYLKDD
jgi:hypothetical protein